MENKQPSSFIRWFNKRKQKAMWIHKNINGRKKFRTIYWSLFILLILCFVTSGLCFGLSGYSYNYDDNVPSGSLTSQPLLIAAIVIFFLSFLFGMYLAIYLPILFKESKMDYFKTDEYRNEVNKLEQIDLTKLSRNQIKWYYKLGYINKTTYLYHKNFTKKEKKVISN